MCYTLYAVQCFLYESTINRALPEIFMIYGGIL